MNIFNIRSTAMRCVLGGLLTSAILVVLNWGTYFEQWDWKVLLWLRYYYPQYEKTYGVVSGIILLVVTVTLLGVVLPFVARAVLRSTHRWMSGLLFFVTTVLGLVILYGVSELVLSGKTQYARVLQDIANNWPSFLLTTGFFVVLPFLIITLSMVVWRHRSLLTKKSAPITKTP